MILFKDETSALLLAHSTVQLFDHKTTTVLKQIRSLDHVHTYSGCLFGANWLDLQIAAGTVMRELLVWNTQSDTVKRFSGQEGAIFGISFLDQNTVASCSDDRTIRIWNIDTGLIEKTLYGHLARVWKCKIVNAHLLSISEDGTIKQWDLEKQECIKTIQAHTHNVWSFDVDLENDILISGGGDAGIKAWDLKSFEKETAPVEIHLQMTPRNFVAHLETLYVCGDPGIILKRSTQSETPAGEMTFNPKDIFYKDHRLRGNVSMHISQSGILAVGTSTGLIFIASIQNQFEPLFLQHCDCWIEQVLVSDKNLLVYVNHQQPVSLYHLSIEDGKINATRVKQLDISQLVISSLEVLDDTVILGTKKGSLLVFDQQKRVFPGVHTQAILETRSQVKECLQISSVGADGYYCESLIQDKLTRLSQSRVSRGHCTKIIQTQGHLLIASYFDKWIELYDLTLKQKVFQVEIGTTRKKWHIQTDLKQTRLTFIKKTSLFEWKTNCRSLVKLLQQPYLALETRSVCSISNIMVSGGEEGILVCHTIENGSLVFQSRCKNQEGSFKCLQSQVYDGKSLVFSGGSKRTLQCWHLNQMELAPLQTCLLDAELETRIMDLSLLQLDQLWISLACSDGYLRLLTFDGHFEDARKVYLGRCVQKTRLFVYLNDCFVVSCATDGKIVIWSLALQKQWELQVHPSGIKALDLKLDHSLLWIATGGDDGHVSLVSLNLTNWTHQLWNTQAHHSSVCGIVFHKHNIISTSIDQKILFFNNELSKLKEQFMDIPDNSDTKIINNHLVTVGFGVQLHAL
ncbi:WD40-repeat-containing domain protein [Gorgonomyces haynaldii]|nr:WD40-repeat-containing domain protein [Gorgonomyces haynaldii]